MNNFQGIREIAECHGFSEGNTLSDRAGYGLGNEYGEQDTEDDTHQGDAEAYDVGCFSLSRHFFLLAADSISHLLGDLGCHFSHVLCHSSLNLSCLEKIIQTTLIQLGLGHDIAHQRAFLGYGELGVQCLTTSNNLVKHGLGPIQAFFLTSP